MRTILLSLSFFLSSIFCYGQKWKANIDEINNVIKSDSHGDSIRKYFTSSYHHNPKNDLLIAAFYSNKLDLNNKKVEKMAPGIKKYLKHIADGYEMSMNSYGGRYAIPIFDSTGIIITVNGINPKNAHEYEFRVLENKTKVLVPWTQPRIFTKAYLMTRIADPAKVDELTAYLGQFKTDYDNALTFEVRKKALPDSICNALSAYWIKWKPQVAGVFTFAEFPNFLNTFNRQWGNRILRNSFNEDWSSDSTLFKKQSDFRHNENNLIFYLEDVIGSKDITQYNLVKGKDSTGWKANGFDFNLVWLKDLTPGNYILKIRYRMQPEHITAYPFTIHALWYQTLWAKIILAILILSTLGFVFLLLRSGRQSKKTEMQRIGKQMVQTELKSIRSQFNPHFVFNALSSIQGLITKNDSQNASKYLLEFSSLMRDSLNASNSEFVSISTEMRILENYLKLEKLRFGFNYQINISPLIDINAIEIPSLFLQPLLENAVKHGVSSLQERGHLNLVFELSVPDMVVSITDNGKGFPEDVNFEGFGLQLTKERIKLLNQTLNGQQIDFSVKRFDGKTKVIVYFKNWLL